MKVMITGANGTIGTDLVDQFSKNNEVFAFYRTYNLAVKKIMVQKPFSVEKNMLAAQALSIMQHNRITSLCVHDKLKKNKTIGLIHIHHILDANIV